MRILLTGASSFTGSWFASTLAKAGHHVTATFRNSLDCYAGIRRTRIESILGHVEAVWGLEFGDDRFLEIVRAGDFNIFCHHAAEMSDYRSWDFDPIEACRKNTRNARAVLTALAERKCRRLIFTGSVFEPYEGIGDRTKRAFNPYGLSKHLSFELFRMEAERLGLRSDKFVVPNPFGPFEEARFTTYLVKEWMAGRTPVVATPAYVRDNIHVSLLACCYRAFCETPVEHNCVNRATPSGYIESQGAFARRVGWEIGPRLGCSCEVKLTDQRDFPEPLIRTNDDIAFCTHPEWSESAAWDELAVYYAGLFVNCSAVVLAGQS